MDGSRFDALTRLLGTRRTALAGVLGGMAALLGLTSPEEATAHNFANRCRQLPNPVKRRACLRRARAHNRKHRKHRCKPKPPARFCGGRCGGSAINNCDKRVACPACPAGRTCLSNGSCNRICSVLGEPGDCPVGCVCGVDSVEGTLLCFPSTIGSCGQLTQPCASTAECPLGQFCTMECGVQGLCIPVCPI